MTKLLCAIYLILACSILNAGAQIRFVSAEIENLFMLLPEDCRSVFQDSNLSENKFEKKCLLEQGANVVLSIEDNILSHLGLNIFDKEEMVYFPVETFYFIERFFLKYLLINEVSVFKSSIRDNDIHLLVNNRDFYSSQFANKENLTRLLDNENSSKILTKDSLSYIFKVYDHTLQLELRFPANNAIIKGMDKVELDNVLLQNLENYKQSVSNSIMKTMFCNNNLVRIAEKELYCLQGSSYHTDITSDLFYVKSGNEYSLVFEPNYLNESFSNLFLTGDLNPDATLQLSHIQYGSSRVNINISLGSFISYFKNNGYELFFGNENCKPDDMIATMIIYSPFFNHVNLLHITTNADEIFNENGSIKARLFTYIPSDNIKNLLGVYNDFHKLYFNYDE